MKAKVGTWYSPAWSYRISPTSWLSVCYWALAASIVASNPPSGWVAILPRLKIAVEKPYTLFANPTFNPKFGREYLVVGSQLHVHDDATVFSNKTCRQKVCIYLSRLPPPATKRAVISPGRDSKQSFDLWEPIIAVQMMAAHSRCWRTATMVKHVDHQPP